MKLIKYCNLVLLGIIIILSTTVIVDGQQNTEISMIKIGEDTIGERKEYDIHAAWMGEDSNYLFFVVRYSSLGTWGIFTNITLRTQNDDLFIIMAWNNNGGSSIEILPAISLEEVAMHTTDFSPRIQYGPQRIRTDLQNNEIGIYVDWDFFGGKQDLDVVFWSGMSIDWSGMPSQNEFDKLPNTSHLTYAGVTQVDRVVDFEKLSGDGITLGNETITSIEGNGTAISTSPPSSDNNSTDWETIGFLILIISSFFGVRYAMRNYKILSRRTVDTLEESAVVRAIRRSGSRQGAVQERFVLGLNRKVPVCCYQTARLQERYCLCGRVVTSDLQDLFNMDEKGEGSED
jgi:hypothetical protein